MNEYGAEAEHVASLAELGKKTLTASFALRYVPDIKNVTRKVVEARFNAFCSLAFERRRLTMVCEELHLVTRPSWAPSAWSACTLLGRHGALSIIGVSQRPAHVDKDFFSCCNSVSTGRLNFEDDIQCLARVLRRPYTEVAELKPFSFIARNMDSGEVVNGHTDQLIAAMGGKPGRKLAKSAPVTK